VLDVAARLFAEQGVSMVTLRDIATAAQVNLGLISRYIGSRDDLHRAVFEDLTAQLTAEIRTSPTASRGFDRDSVMGRWTRLLTFLVVTRPEVAVEVGSGPVRELRSVIEQVYGLTEDAAALRVAQVMGSAVGWRLFESFLIESSGLGDVPIEEIREELTRTHRRIASTPLPSPPDPRLRE